MWALHGAVALVVAFVAADEAGFAYPEALLAPPLLWIEGMAFRLQNRHIQDYETPIQVWQTWRLDQVAWNCIARYVISEIGLAPTCRAPAQYHTSEARGLCMVHAINRLVPDLIPISSATIADWLTTSGLDASLMTEVDAVAAASAGSFTPKVFGSLAAFEVIADMRTDGWNYDGALAKDGEPCEANCRPFTDTTGYTPVNSPWVLTDATRWQPLIEDDNLGFFYAQEHTVPHIGLRARPAVLTREEVDARSLADPDYDLVAETASAIFNVASLNDFKKTLVGFLDNKINIGGGLIWSLREAYSLSLEAQVFYHYGYASAELDAVILAWKEKVKHDKIRPTSRVHMMGAAPVDYYTAAQEVPARDWQPFIRVMPHTEFPSGSGCICTAIMQFVDAFVQGEYGAESFETTWPFAAGSSPYEAGVPAEAFTVTFKTMKQLRDMCGQTRLWGGMHFRASVPRAYELCDGVGTTAYTRLMPTLLGTGTYAELMDDSKRKYDLGPA